MLFRPPTSRRRTYLIQEPYDDDAVRFIETMFRTYGWRPVCWYRDPKERHYGERRYPILTSMYIEAAYDVDGSDLPAFATAMHEKYDIAAVIPYREDTVEVAAELLPHLDVDWLDGPTLGRFRDKHALKRHIAETSPEVRVPESRYVRTVDDVFDPTPPDRFVLKPNDGMGSAYLGFFDHDNRLEVQAHLDRAPGTLWIMEEYIDGTEYRVNGLVRRDGSVQPLVCIEYVPMTVTDTFTLAYATEHTIRTTDDRWPTFIEYTEAIMKASGLRGSPFHLEFRVDENGPAMVDFGPRVPSEANGVMMSYLHPDRPDIYSVAARDYVGDNRFAMDPVDYSNYDAGTTMTISGVSNQDGMVSKLRGVEEVEAMPEFVSWSVKPHRGDRVRVTDELRATTYIANFRHGGPDRDSSMALSDKVRGLLQFEVAETPVAKAKIFGSELPERVERKGRWLLHRAASRTTTD